MSNIEAQPASVEHGLVTPERNDRRTVAGPLIFAVAPWLCAWVGSYVIHKAIVSFALYHGLCFSAAAYYRNRLGPREHRSLPLHRWATIAVACLAVCAATYIAIGYLGWLVDATRIRHALARQGIPATWDAFGLLCAYFAVVNPVAEELFWRGSIYLRLRYGGWSVKRSAMVTALLFGSWHWLIIRLFFSPALAVLVTVGVVAIGWVFARLYERARSVPILVLIHGLAADTPILIALWAAVLRGR